MDAVLLGIAASADKRSKQNATAIENLKGGWRYKGAVEDYAHLPSSGNKIGDVWTTLDDGNEYAWEAVDGVNQWIQIGGVVNPLTDAEVINALGAYPIDLTITNGTYTGSPYVLGTQTITITPSTGYEAPASITVNGTTGTSGSTGVTWSYSNGVITLSNATDVVEISATCETAIKCTVANLGSENPSNVTFTKDADFTKAGLGIEDVTVGTDVFVKIPTMYRKVESVSDNQITSFTVSNKPGSGFVPYSCFVDENGNTLPYILIGKYWNTSSSGCVSTTEADGAAMKLSDTNRGYATAKGTGYQLFDWQIQKLWQDLIICLKETVNTNAGTAWTYDELGIYWAKGIGWIDGIIASSQSWRYCTKPSKYASLSGTSDPIPSDYSTASYARQTTTPAEVSKLGYDENCPFFSYATAVTVNYSYDTYYCDSCNYASGNYPVNSSPGIVNAVAGVYQYGAAQGWNVSQSVRLCYRPI